MGNDMKKIAVILSGCGHLDGSEIHEATMSLWAIHKHGAEFHCFAPDKKQHHIINHSTGEEQGGSRNILIESARIARGKISALSLYKAEDFDALLLPGGFGAAKNLSSYAFDGESMNVDPDVENALLETRKAQKPIGALCIAPIILAKIFPGVALTLGQESAAVEHAEQMGANMQTTHHGQIVIDEALKVVTSPCYMLESRIDQIGDGAEAVVKALLEFCH